MTAETEKPDWSCGHYMYKDDTYPRLNEDTPPAAIYWLTLDECPQEHGGGMVSTPPEDPKELT